MVMHSKAVSIAVGALVLFSLSLPAAAHPVRWTAVGPNGPNIGSGKINAFAYVQSNPNIMYFGGGWGNTPRESPSQSGVFGTTDGGAHWTALDNGLTNVDGTISSVINGLWLDQSNPSVLLAATEFGGTFRSTNAGSTWVNVDRSEATQFAQVGSTLYVATSRGVLASVDDGATWTVSLSVASGATTVVTAAGATYAGSMAGDVYRLSGGTWTLTGHPGTGPVHNIAIDPFKVATVYANVDDASAWNENLYGSIDGGVTWKFINCPCSIGAQALAASLVVPHRMYLGDDGGGTIYNFIADGNPNPVFHSGAQPYGVDMRYIVPAAATVNTDDACYLLEDQGLFYAARCTTGFAPPLNANVNDTLAYDVKVDANAKNAIVPLQDNSAAYTVTGGTSWNYNNAAGGGEGGEAFVNPVNTQYCYFAHPDSGLWMSSDSCASFNLTVSSGFASVTFDPTHAGKLYGITNADTNAASIEMSTNNGGSWSAVSWQHFTNPYQVLVSPADANTIVVATGTATTASHFYYSHDGGTTFHLATGLPTRALPAQTIYFPVDRFFAAFEPGAPGTVLVADHDPATDDVLIYRSTDNAQTFTKVKRFVQPVPSRPWPHLLFPTPDERNPKTHYYYATRFFGNRLSFNPQAGTGVTPAVVLTTRFGAFASFDAGTTWQRIDKNAIAHHFVGISWNNGFVFLASFGEGVIRSDRPLQ
jgi:hypothetical protein